MSHNTSSALTTWQLLAPHVSRKTSMLPLNSEPAMLFLFTQSD